MHNLDFFSFFSPIPSWTGPEAFLMFEWRSSANEFPYRNYIMCLQILIESLFQLNEDVNEKATKGSLEQEESFSSSREKA